MDLVDCRLVVNIAQTESLTQGGRDTFLSLPAASLRLKALETELGVRLFIRSNQGMVMTDAGRCVLKHARIVLADIDSLQSDLMAFKDRSRLALRVAANTSYVTDFLPELVRAYLGTHPDVRIDVQSARKSEIEAGIMADRIDIGFISSSTAQFSVEPVDFGADPLVMITGAKSSLARLPCIDIAQFARCDHVVLDEHSTLTAYLRERLSEQGLALNVRVSVADYRSLHDMVAANIGVGVIHLSLAQRYAHPNIRCVSLDAEWARHRRFALVADGARSVHSVNDFLSFVVTHWHGMFGPPSTVEPSRRQLKPPKRSVRLQHE